jgi:hypothetical protein
MLPPMNEYSMAATTVGTPSMAPVPTMIASFRPVVLDGRLEARAVRLGVGERQRVNRSQARVVLFPDALVEQHREAIGGRHPEVVRALRADLQVADELFVVDHPPARRALDPQALRHPARFVRRGHRLAGLLEPSHSRGG